MRTHTGEHPFGCSHPLCEKTFKSKKSLSKHCRMRHSDNRPFKCERCNLVIFYFCYLRFFIYIIVNQFNFLFIGIFRKKQIKRSLEKKNFM